MSREFSLTGILFLREREGFSPVVYPDADGWSIGYGTYLTPRQLKEYKDRTITEAEGHELMMGEVNSVAAFLNKRVKVPLSQNQFDALVSFVYNIGVNGFARSTILRKLNAADYEGAAAEFPRWKYTTKKGKKVISDGLIERRKLERELFES